MVHSGSIDDVVLSAFLRRSCLDVLEHRFFLFPHVVLSILVIIVGRWRDCKQQGDEDHEGRHSCLAFDPRRVRLSLTLYRIAIVVHFRVGG